MENFSQSDDLICPIRYALNIIGGKWKLPVLCLLASGKPTRYGEIKRKIRGITNMMLSQTLKELEHDSIIHRKQYNEIPPKVEYSLTTNGKSLLPTLEILSSWGSSQLSQKGDKTDVCKICKPE